MKKIVNKNRSKYLFEQNDVIKIKSEIKNKNYTYREIQKMLGFKSPSTSYDKMSGKMTINEIELRKIEEMLGLEFNVTKVEYNIETYIKEIINICWKERLTFSYKTFEQNVFLKLKGKK